MKYELPKEPPVGSKLLCTDFDESQYIYVSWGVPKRNESDVTVGRRYLLEGTTSVYYDGCSWATLLHRFKTVEDYVDEDAEFRKELASIIYHWSWTNFSPEAWDVVDNGLKIVVNRVRDYDAKKKEK